MNTTQHVVFTGVLQVSSHPHFYLRMTFVLFDIMQHLNHM